MTNARVAIGTIQNASRDAAKLGAQLPAEFNRSYENLVKVADQVRDFDPPRALADAVLDAMAAGKDPLGSAAVKDAAVTQALAEALPSIQNRMDQRVATYVSQNAHMVLDAFRGPFATAADTINQAVEQFNGLAIDDAAGILKLGGASAQAWVKAREADAAIGLILSNWKRLGAISTALRVNPMYQVLAIADIDGPTFLADQLKSSRLSAWEIARRGYTLSLATPEVLEERTQAVHAAQAGADFARGSAFRDHVRKTHPPIVVNA